MASGGKRGCPTLNLLQSPRSDEETHDADPSEPVHIDTSSSGTQRDAIVSPNPNSTSESSFRANSYVSLVAPQEGAELKYVPITVINGTKCAKLDKADVENEL